MYKTNSSDCVLMVRPACFGQNPQTIGDNKFQMEAKEQISKEEIHQRALNEFDNYVNILRQNGVKVIILEDSCEPAKPDAIFPNNWFTTDTKQILIYPMMSKNRRLQRQLPLIPTLQAQGFVIPPIIDISANQLEGQIVEGTGSMVFDHQNKIAYACRSQRTCQKLFQLISQKYYEYTPHCFTAKWIDDSLIYHTNMIISVCSNFVIACLQSIPDKQEQQKIRDSIQQSKGLNGNKKSLIELKLDQIDSYCGNVLEVKNSEGKLFLVVGQQAYKCYKPEQICEIEKFVQKIIVVSIPTIQKYGGGGTRCMLAEIFLNKS